MLGEADAKKHVGGRLRALAQHVDIDQAASFGHLSGDAERRRVEHRLLVAPVRHLCEAVAEETADAGREVAVRLGHRLLDDVLREG